MRSSKVRLYIRIRLEGKDVYADPVFNKNGLLREGYALLDGRAISHAEGVYYLRYASLGSGRRWESVGRFAEAAIEIAHLELNPAGELSETERHGCEKEALLIEAIPQQALCFYSRLYWPRLLHLYSLTVRRKFVHLGVSSAIVSQWKTPSGTMEVISYARNVD